YQSPALVHPGQQGPDADARALGVGVAADHDLLLADAFDLAPVRRPGALIGRIAPLRDDPLEAQPARPREELGALADHVIAVLERIDRGRLQQPLEQGL